MSLVKTMPKATPQYITVDVDAMPKIPDAIRELDPDAINSYEEEMRIFWISLADSINSIIEKVES